MQKQTAPASDCSGAAKASKGMQQTFLLVLRLARKIELAEFLLLMQWKNNTRGFLD